MNSKGKALGKLKGIKNGAGDFSKVKFTPKSDKEARLFKKTFQSKTA